MKIITTIAALLLAIPLILKNRKPKHVVVNTCGDRTIEDLRYAIDEFLN